MVFSVELIMRNPHIGPSYQVMLEGTGVLPNSSSCYIYSERFKLLPHSLGKTTINLTRTHIVLPSIDRILNISEESLLQPEETQPVDQHRLDEVLERATARGDARGVEVGQIIATLREDVARQQFAYWPWIIGIISAVLIMGILGTILVKLCKVRALRKKRPRSATTLRGSQIMNLQNTKLQVMREGEGERMMDMELGPSNEDTETGQPSPTMFVRPGQALPESQ